MCKIDFKEGDIVRLKSGGPNMTIEEYPCKEMKLIYDDRARCVWFDDKHNEHHQTFKLLVLVKDIND